MSMDPDPNRPSVAGTPSYEAPPSSEISPTYEAPPSVPAPAPGPPVPIGGTNGFAIAALVLGILGLVGFPPFIPSILALIFGYKGKREIDRSGGTQQGRGLAVAGIVLGWIGFLLMLLAFAALAFAFAWSTSEQIGGIFRFDR